MRVSAGSLRGTRNGGFLHLLRSDGPSRSSVAPGSRRVRIPSATPRRDDLPALAAAYAAAVTPSMLDWLAGHLGVTAASLVRLGVGWAYDAGRRFANGPVVFDAGDVLRIAPAAVTWSFPARDAAGAVVGIWRRLPDGDKRSVWGSRDGLFQPERPAEPPAQFAGRLFVAEGASDTAALLSLGFDAVGRTGCAGSHRHLTTLVANRRPPELVVVSDVDADGRGQRAAEALAGALTAYCRNIRVIRPPPPFKYARAWVTVGKANCRDIERTVASAHIRRLIIRPNVVRERAREPEVNRAV